MRYLFISFVVSFALSSCGLKQLASASASAENKNHANDSLILPVTVIVTNDALEGRQMNTEDYPRTATVNWFDTSATPIAAYGAAQSLWLAPKGYTGTGDAGADGSVFITLYPLRGSKEIPPFIHYQRIPACVGCMMSAAAPYFEDAKKDLINNFDSVMLNCVSIPNNLIIQKKSATLVTYSYMKNNKFQITGVAYYQPPGDSGNGAFEQAEFALGPDKKAMTDLLVAQYINMWGLK